MELTSIQKKYIIDTNDLIEMMDNEDVLLIDTREPEDYAIEHIPGAINIYDIFTYLAVDENNCYGELSQYFTKIFSDAGLKENQSVVIYEDAMDNGYGRSCRGLFILSFLGHKNVKVLHGGYQAWINSNLPVTKNIPRISPSNFIPKIDQSIIVTKEEMLMAIENPEIIILDCRDRAEWVAISSSPYGPDFTPRKGRIPNAIWMEWYNTMKYENHIPWFKSPEELNELFKSHGLNEQSNIYVYCFKGARTSNTFMALKMAGFENVKNYLGSWNEWSRDESLPIEKGYPKHK
jgi:thiosulfate/3-mercaptopyruvate sulfurtransferase